MSYYNLDPTGDGEALARRLEQHHDYRVLRRLPGPNEIWCRSAPLPTGTIRLGIIDCETTGLDPFRHKLIELAVTKLTIDEASGAVTDVLAPISWLEDSGEPLAVEIEALTGISDADVRGHRFDEDTVTRMFDDVDMLVAHNARFDAGFIGQRFPNLTYPWACSASEIEWTAHGLTDGRSIGALLTAAGHFMPDAHRAGPDAWALACLLMMRANDGRAIAAHLIEAAMRTTQRLYATNAPFSVKDSLKHAGYRWSTTRRRWWIEGDPELIANEATWLRALHPLIEPTTETIDCFNRHTS